MPTAVQLLAAVPDVANLFQFITDVAKRNPLVFSDSDEDERGKCKCGMLKYEVTTDKLKDEQEVIVGILGGVGPAAGVLLHELVLRHTDNGGTDQGHVDVIHLSRSHDTTDRTQYLLRVNADHEMVNPAEGMARTAAMLGHCAQQRKARVVAGVPCNTFHAPRIWNEFVRLVQVQEAPVRLLHMLHETVEMIQKMDQHATKVGLLCTTGTRQSRVYHDLLEAKGFEVVQVNEILQTELHDDIYKIKSTAPDVTQNFSRYAEELVKQGATVIIMGCTEIPFAFAGQSRVQNAILVDPMVALARALIRETNPQRLKPLSVK
eukprot:172644_1